LISKNYFKVNNADKFWSLPQERILYLDINGGEPSISKNYKNLLNNLPCNLKSLRVNTNGAVMLPILKKINSQGINVTVTVSFDGVGPIHDYVRWPIKWQKFQKNLLEYQSYNLYNLNLWTTVNALNINDLKNILQFAKKHNIDHSYGLLLQPKELNVTYSNRLTVHAKQMFEVDADEHLVQLSKLIAVDVDNQREFDEFVRRQDQLRNINIKNFIK
jgi:MoaA/NifB/PqqE/SkfB family radical SAM enzyme